MAKVILSDEVTKDNGNTEQDRLSMEVKHFDGKYTLSVQKETVTKRKEGWSSISFILFEKGNFNYGLSLGRKSQKKLDKLNLIIENNKDTLTELWLNDKFVEMGKLVQSNALQNNII